MARKRPAPAPEPDAEQLVFPWRLQVGDIVLDDGQRLEVITRPVSFGRGKSCPKEQPAARREMAWGAWRKVRVVRRAA